MKDLTKEMYFNGNSETTPREINKLANDIISSTWEINIYRGRTSKINLKDSGWKFEFNSRKRAAGLCDPRNKTIYISKYLLSQNLNKGLEFENTIRHELAHAIDFEMRGTSDHGRIWKAIAREVLCTAKRCYTNSEIADKKSKYTLVCGNCKKETPSHKIKKRQAACGSCCNTYNYGRFSSDYILEQIKNY